MMNTSINSPRNTSRRKIIWGVGIGLSIAVLLVSGWFWYSASDQVQTKLDALRAKGLPTTAQEVNAYYAIPAGATDRTQEWVTAIDSLLLASPQTSAEPLPVVTPPDLR